MKSKHVALDGTGNRTQHAERSQAVLHARVSWWILNERQTALAACSFIVVRKGAHQLPHTGRGFVLSWYAAVPKRKTNQGQASAR